MIDKTTEGHTAEPDEVEAILHNVCGYHLSERDPAHRYEVLTREQVLYDALVTAIRRERGRALAELVSNGKKLTEIADMTNLRTRQRVQRLITVYRTAEAAMGFPELPAADADPQTEPVPVVADDPGVRVPAQRVPVEGVTDDGADHGVEAEPPAEPTGQLEVAWPDFFATADGEDGTGEGGSWWRRKRTGAA